MKQRRVNMLFPFSVMLGTAAAGVFLIRGVSAGDGAEAAANMMVGLILALGVLEHWFLVLPIQDSKLWQWAMPATESTDEALTGSAAQRPDQTRLIDPVNSVGIEKRQLAGSRSL